MQLAGSCYFALNRRTPPRGSPHALSRGSADPLSSTDPLSLSPRAFSPTARTPSLPRILLLLPWTPPHHSVSAARTLSLPRTLSLYCCGPLPTIPSPSARTLSLPRTLSLYCCGPLSTIPSPSARTLSLPRTLSLYCCGPLPTIPSSDGADPPLSPLPRPPPHHSVSAARTFSLPRTLSLYCRGPLPTIPSSVGADPLSSTDPISLAARTPSGHRRGPPLTAVQLRGWWDDGL
ncbi:hypothetical protein niasHT_037894 [Heterodera trifolii]|uniref:Uncharacterized protein n=1 Tax=Heterodera trifolii TaxID=157864 RepID=A0ABD2IHF2_9BILA